MRTLIAALAVALLLAAGAQASPVAAKTCHAPKYPSSGYFTSLKVTHVSCSTGRKLALAYFRCRTQNGLAGRCKRHVMGYSCKEVRDSIPTEIDARVTCRLGSRTIVHTYQQNT